MLPQNEEAAWQLTDTGWIYLVGDADRAGKTLITLLVDNLDEQVAALAEREITFAQPGS